MIPFRSKHDPVERKTGGRSPADKIFSVGAVELSKRASRAASAWPTSPTDPRRRCTGSARGRQRPVATPSPTAGSSPTASWAIFDFARHCRLQSCRRITERTAAILSPECGAESAVTPPIAAAHRSLFRASARILSATDHNWAIPAISNRDHMPQKPALSAYHSAKTSLFSAFSAFQDRRRRKYAPDL